MKRALLLVLLLTSCAVRPGVQLHNCSVYTLDSAPELLYWKVCK